MRGIRIWASDVPEVKQVLGEHLHDALGLARAESGVHKLAVLETFGHDRSYGRLDRG